MGWKSSAWINNSGARLEPKPFRSEERIEWNRFVGNGEHRLGLSGRLGPIPRQSAAGWPYAVEIRNKNFLHPEYFATLKRHSVTHVFNSWGEMPAVKEQIALPDPRTNPKLCAARFLLKPGRKYAESVKLFEPHDKIKEPNPDARAAGAALIKEKVWRRNQAAKPMFT